MSLMILLMETFQKRVRASYISFFGLESLLFVLLVSIIHLFTFLSSLISGAGFEWEDDFSLLPLPTSSKGSPPDVTTKQSLPSSSSKPVAQVSRFTVSPSNVSRFSITHVSDSDMDSAGGQKLNNF